MKRIIELDTENRKKICRTYGVTKGALSHALRFRRNSKLAIAMRNMAMENGGILLEEKNNNTKFITQ
jgi:hypothetical protein